MVKKSSKQEFIAKAKEVHGDKYDYDKFDYVNAVTKGIIVCQVHGEFLQSPNVHLRNHGCPTCAKENFNKIGKLTFDIFKERADVIHNSKYRYIRKELSKNKDKVEIICPIHGSFYQSASLHLSGQGCPKCGDDEKRRKMANTVESFIVAANNVHGGKYDYSMVKEYRNNKTKVPIICKEHGVFLQRPFDHVIKGYGCPKCTGRGRTLEDFILEANKVHGNKYTYMEYSSSEEKIPIKCNTCGNIFYQKPWSHLQGHGCPFCKQSHLENEVCDTLQGNGIAYETQKTFEWLRYRQPLFVDFFIEKYNIGIECQGSQHFPNSRNFGGDDNYELISFRDKLKRDLCDKHGIEIIYFTHENVEEPYIGKVFKTVEELIGYINSKEM